MRYVVKLFILCLVSLSSYSQRFNTMSDLRSRPGTDMSIVTLLGNSTANDGNGDTFYWNDTDVQTDNNVTVIKVTGQSTGSWLRLKILNTKVGSFTTSALALTTSYTVTHGIGIVPSAIIYTPTSLNAANLSYVSAKTATTFVITFLTVPILGTNNLTFDWLVRFSFPLLSTIVLCTSLFYKKK